MSDLVYSKRQGSDLCTGENFNKVLFKEGEKDGLLRRFSVSVSLEGEVLSRLSGVSVVENRNVTISKIFGRSGIFKWLG